MLSMCSFPDGHLKSIHWIWETLHLVCQVICVFSRMCSVPLCSSAEHNGVCRESAGVTRVLTLWQRALGCSHIVKLSVKMTPRHSSIQREVLLWQVVWRNKLSVEYNVHTQCYFRHSAVSSLYVSVLEFKADCHWSDQSSVPRPSIYSSPRELSAFSLLPLSLYTFVSNFNLRLLQPHFQHHLPTCLTTAQGLWFFTERF